MVFLLKNKNKILTKFIIIGLVLLFSGILNCNTTYNNLQKHSIEQEMSIEGIKKIIDETPLIEGALFNPLHLIRSINSLHPLGKEKILLLLRLYINNNDVQEKKDYEKIYLILRLLFIPESNEAYRKMPEIRLGEPDIIPNKEITDWPFFPLTLKGDIPFLLIQGYTISGILHPYSLLDYIEYCEKYCKIRDNPLCPANNVFLIVDGLTESDNWKNLISKSRYPIIENYVYMIREQAIRMVSSIHIPENLLNKELLFPMNWNLIFDAYSKLNVVWDTCSNNYIIKFE